MAPGTRKVVAGDRKQGGERFALGREPSQPQILGRAMNLTCDMCGELRRSAPNKFKRFAQSYKDWARPLDTCGNARNAHAFNSLST